MDYFLSCADMESPNMETPNIDSPDGDDHYCERLIRLGAPPTYYEQPQIPENLVGREDFGFSDQDRLYVCPQNLFKLHPDFDDYVDRAVAIAGDKGEQAEISAKISAAWPKLYRDGESLKEFKAFFVEASAAAGRGQSLSAWLPV